MSDKTGQVNPSLYSKPDSERSDSQSTGSAGKRVVTLLKGMTLLLSLTVGLLHLAGRISAQSDRDRDRRGNVQREGAFDAQISGNAQRMMEEGKQIFRFDTFGDEVFWTDTLKLHRAIEGSKFGGVILITISGYLGGELVFRHGVAVNPQYDTGGEARAKARAS